MDTADYIDDVQPILVQFEHGILNTDQKANIGFKYMRSKVPSSKKRMLVADTENHSYVGMVTKKQQSLMRYYIGIVDEKTNRVEEVVPCRHCTLKPKLKKRIDMRDPTEVVQEKSFRQKNDTLVEAFGTTKQKRLVASRKRNEEVHSTISDKVSEVAKQIISKTPQSPSQTPEVNDDVSDIIPPLNMEATSLDDMYHVDDIISFQEYSSLKELSREFADCDNELTMLQWKKENTHPEFVLHHLSSLPSNPARREELLCYLFFMKQLLYMFKLRSKNIRKAQCNEVPEELRKNLFDKFSVSENYPLRSMPKKCKDKLLAHILVLALIIEHYELNCNLLLKDLKIGVQRITKLFRAIGCTVKTSGKRKKGEEEDGPPAEVQIHAYLHLPKLATVKTPKSKPADKSNENGNMNTEHSKTPPDTPVKPKSKDPSTPKRQKVKKESMD